MKNKYVIHSFKSDYSQNDIYKLEQKWQQAHSAGARTVAPIAPFWFLYDYEQSSCSTAWR